MRATAAQVGVQLAPVPKPATRPPALLGVGWNFLFIGATPSLTEAYSATEKAKNQGVNDLPVFCVVALTATSFGALHAGVGWTVLNAAVVPALVPVMAACLWLAAGHRAGAGVLSRPDGSCQSASGSGTSIDGWPRF